MNTNRCSQCGSEVVPGTDRCPRCGAFYDQRTNFQQNNYPPYPNNQMPQQPPKKNSTVVIVVIVIVSFFFIGLLAAIFVPAFIGYNAKLKQHNSADLSYAYRYSDEYLRTKNKCSNQSECITAEDIDCILESNEFMF